MNVTTKIADGKDYLNEADESLVKQSDEVLKQTENLAESILEEYGRDMDAFLDADGKPTSLKVPAWLGNGDDKEETMVEITGAKLLHSCRAVLLTKNGDFVEMFEVNAMWRKAVGMAMLTTYLNS